MPAHFLFGAAPGFATGSFVEPAQLIDENHVESLLRESQWFLAYDFAKESPHLSRSLKLKKFAAKALLRLGAVSEATDVLRELCPEIDLKKPEWAQMYQTARTAMETMRAHPEPSLDSLPAFAELIATLTRAGVALGISQNSDEETLRLLARAYKVGWWESHDPGKARQCRDTYQRAFTASGGYRACINAAFMSAILAHLLRHDPTQAGIEADAAQQLAKRALDACERARTGATGKALFWILATMGEAHLLLHDADAAFTHYRQAAEAAEVEPRIGKVRLSEMWVASVVQQLRTLEQHGVVAQERVFRVLKPPTVVVFVGHMTDKADRPVRRFPEESEAKVREAIEAHLQRYNVKIGYSSAACGSDLLFIEAMRARDGEVNIVLPFDTNDFIRTSVSRPGTQWEERFRRAISAPENTVTHSTEEEFLETTDLYFFCNNTVHGLATLRARSLGTEPLLLAVYDGVSDPINGGAKYVMDRWPDPDTLKEIPLPAPAPPPAVHAPGRRLPVPPQEPSNRVIRTLLFADVVGFSKLAEKHIPHYVYAFLKEVAQCLTNCQVQPITKNTWGDALFAVMKKAIPMVEYARALQNVVCHPNWAGKFPKAMSVRIGLHAGPVLDETDPITGGRNFFGSHVNRTARLEPITLPGHIYASEQFVGMLITEQRAIDAELRAANLPKREWPFTCDHIGVLSLDKSFGKASLYHIRSRESATRPPPSTGITP